MARDDMYVIMYKVIAYLYECMKLGIKPVDNKWDAAAMDIPQSYWKQIVGEMIDHGLISGITYTKVAGGGIVIEPFDPVVTMEGVQFAQENSMMAKAKKFLQDTKASVPFV